MKIRPIIAPSVTWAMKNSTPKNRNLCQKCYIFEKEGCPRNILNATQKRLLIATRCEVYLKQN